MRHGWRRFLILIALQGGDFNVKVADDVKLRGSVFGATIMKPNMANRFSGEVLKGVTLQNADLELD